MSKTRYTIGVEEEGTVGGIPAHILQCAVDDHPASIEYVMEMLACAHNTIEDQYGKGAKMYIEFAAFALRHILLSDDKVIYERERERPAATD